MFFRLSNKIGMDTNLQRCRACLAQSGKLIPLSVFSIASRNTLHMSDIFMLCAAIQITPNDEFSQYACSDCVISAEKAYLFKKQCEHSEKIWNEFKKRQKNEATFELTASPTPNSQNKIVDYNYETEMIETKCIEIHEEVKMEEFSCKYCFTIFTDEAKLSRHELAHTIQPKQLVVKEYAIYGCRQCSADCKTAEGFMEHCHRLHEDSIEELHYRCKLCAGGFDGLSQLSVHVSKRHHKNLRTWIVPHTKQARSVWPQSCKYCKFPLKSHRERLRHLDQQHSDLKKFSCDKCGKKFFRKCDLNLHLEIHKEVKSHMCQYCGRGFASSSNLIKHLRIHTGEKPFKCKDCNASFGQQEALRAHSFIHVSDSNFECKECHRKFRRPDTFRQHMRAHSGDVPKYSCHLCPKQLKEATGLRKHIKTHANERACVCKVCGKGFNRKHNLEAHLKTHTGEKPYACTICKKTFGYAHSLRSHTARYHNDDTAQK